MGAPDLFRAKYREHLTEAIQQVIDQGTPLDAAVAALRISAEDEEPFKDLVRVELRQIEPHNCARYRLPIGKTEAWIAAGRLVR